MINRSTMSRALVKVMSASHQFWYRRTGGRVGGRINGMDVLLLTTHGRKSGKSRTTPLQYVSDGDAYVVVASNGGSDRHPGWWLNLKADPDATVQVKSARRAVRAREASPDEKARLWPRLTALYAGYGDYQQATSREIPVVILTAD
jgi:deazaflavin-dependent oxidoreductase (nitroreductase family)